MKVENPMVNQPATATPAQVISLFRSWDESSTAGPTRVALVGTFAPRKCGIATFTTDIFDQLGAHFQAIGLDVYAIDDAANPMEYGNVTGVIEAGQRDSYIAAARTINESGAEVVWLQHEYGIFGGADGELVCDFVDRIAAPLVITFHTVLERPSANQRRIMEHLISRGSRFMVMSKNGRDRLIDSYGAPRERIEIIPHGAPDRPFGREAEFKRQLGLDEGPVLMTFGLLGPGKGIERVIEALPAIVARHPQAIYRIVGATHPALVAQHGESYREGLEALVRKLGMERHVVWENRFLDTPELLDQLEACDIYLTPYPGLQQSTSGTLSYAVALGKAVVSTPYVHARELLADGVGVLVEPNSSEAIADAVNGLLGQPERLAATKRRAYDKGRSTIWPQFARASVQMLRRAASPLRKDVPLTALPGISAVIAMSDGTGMLQHSIGVVPDRRHGYCLDDNARALMLMNEVRGMAPAEQLHWASTYAAFIQHAWNPDLGRFRNFMRFDRSWCEDVGSEDSNGRALWALGLTAERSPDAGLREWAGHLFDEVAPSMLELGSPRAIAFAALGALGVFRVNPDHADARRLVERAGDLLYRLLEAARRPDWSWFEAVLGYDNPRISQALIEAGHLCGRRDWLCAGLETLTWITGLQTSAQGHFRPIGSDSFGKEGSWLPFDQQPLEAHAAVDAARAAWRATGEQHWIDHAVTAYRWYFGENDRGVVLVDLATGRCRDGVTPRGVNGNCGAESILAFQLAHYGILPMLAAERNDAVTGVPIESQRHSLVHTAADS